MTRFYPIRPMVLDPGKFPGAGWGHKVTRSGKVSKTCPRPLKFYVSYLFSFMIHCQTLVVQVFIDFASKYCDTSY